jgi:predicted small metal-binding protein
MDSLRSVLPTVLKKRGLFAHAQASHVTFATEHWLTQMLPGCKDAFAVERLADATLTISCRHSIAAQECQALLPQLMEHLRREFPATRIEDIRLVRAKK